MKQTYIVPSTEIKAIETAVVIAASGDGWELPGFNSGIFGW